MDRLWLPRLISEGMVLQQGANTSIRGKSKAFDAISVMFCDKEYQTQGNEKGEFTLKFDFLLPGGPYKLKISSVAFGLTTIEEVYIGNVYIASGQSNMELPIERVRWFYDEDWSDYNNPLLRHFKVENNPVFSGTRTEHESGKWLGFSESSIQGVSAISVFLLHQLYSELQIPIGVIQVAVGGTPIQAWLPEGLIMPEDLALLDEYKDDFLRQKKVEEDLYKEQAWQEKLNQLDTGLQESWFKGTDVSKWQEIKIPCEFQTVIGSDFAGAIWLSKEFYLEQPPIASSGLLELGTIVDADVAYINGIKIGQTEYRYPPRRYLVPTNTLRQGKNEIVLRIKCFNGQGRMTEGKKYRLILGNESFDLIGTWKYKIGGYMPFKSNQEFMHYKPTVLYKGMLAPCFSQDIAGVLWYQGESNTDNPSGYQEYLEPFIEFLRKSFRNKELQVAIVQLANFSVDLSLDSGWPKIREAQRLATLHTKAGLIVTIDVGEYNDLHPLNKKAVAGRIGEYLLENYQSPRLESVTLSANGLFWQCHFQRMTKFKNPGQEANGFIGIDTKGESLDLKAIVQADYIQVMKPLDETIIVEIRYAYENDPSKDVIYDDRHFPTSPFSVKLI